MNWLDIAILGVVGVSALLSLIRGLSREVVSLLAWVLAIWAGLVLAAPASEFLSSWIDSPTLRLGAAFVGVFVLVLLVGALVNLLIGKLVGATGFSGTDRLLGMIFGVLRGLVVVALVMLILGLSPMPQERVWQESVMIQGMEPWVCRVGADGWMDRLLALGGSDEALLPEETYWQTYCAGDEPGIPPADAVIVPEEI